MRTPRPIAGSDIKTLPLSPSEAYLLSRIDGTLSEHDLGLVTGLAAEVVGPALDRLAKLGAIDFGTTAASRAPRAPPGTDASPPRSSGAVASSRASNAPDADSSRSLGRSVNERASHSPPLYDPAELDEAVEIERDKKQRILDLFYRLDQLSHYELLGVNESNDKKQIKSAYYLLAPEFHPDKYFRKNLGSYKAKIEAVFTRVTLAHDVLTSKERRAEYDDYLMQMHRNRSMAALLEEASRDVATVTSAVDEAVAAALGSPASTSRPPMSGPRSVRGPRADSVPAGRYSEAPPPTIDPAEIQRDRRGTFARKLGLRGSGPPAPRPVSVPPARYDPKLAGDALRTRYDAAVGEVRRAQIARYADLGKSALERKDHAAAANAYRIAASLAPDDVELRKVATEAQLLASAALADGYMKQAQYEANQDRWTEAALSFAKVCAGRPEDGRAHERVAFATLKSSGNTRRAVEFARRAVELSPQNAEFRITLGRAYMMAGFEKSATGEIERALELAPNDPRIKELASQLRSDTHAKGKVG